MNAVLFCSLGFQVIGCCFPPLRISASSTLRPTFAGVASYAACRGGLKLDKRSQLLLPLECIIKTDWSVWQTFIGQAGKEHPVFELCHAIGGCSPKTGCLKIK
jgi:hypothetical protein